VEVHHVAELADLARSGNRPPWADLTAARMRKTMNDVQLRPDIDAAERLVIGVATGSLDEVKAIAEALRELTE
jgi:hypothetical protein